MACAAALRALLLEQKGQLKEAAELCRTWGTRYPDEVDFRDWEKRISAPGVAGICVSNWGRSDMRTLQRNGILYHLVYASWLMWEPQFGSEDYPDLDRLVFERLYRMHPQQAPGEGAAELTVCHTVQTDIAFRYFFDGVLLDEAFYLLGHHIFRCESSGAELRFPVIFGSNISNTDLKPARYDSPESLADAYEIDRRYLEVVGECYPRRDASGDMWYYCRYPLPEGVMAVEYLRFEPAGACCHPVRLKEFYCSLRQDRRYPFAGAK